MSGSEELTGRILLLWGPQNDPNLLKVKVAELSANSAQVQVENVERLILSQHAQSSFDAVIAGAVPPHCTVHSKDLLVEAARVLVPNGRLILTEPTVQEPSSSLRSPASLSSALKLAGFVNVSVPQKQIAGPDVPSNLSSLLGTSQQITIVSLEAKKPAYEVGASSRLSFALPKTTSTKADVEAVWKFSADDIADEDVELIDDDDLLDDDDLIKPDPASLRAVCGDGTKKRKACKDCTCGLAEELDGTANTPKQTATSSCGNCYLGDAFRCASCPYLGMPAFKPGEKISLSERQLNADN